MPKTKMNFRLSDKHIAIIREHQDIICVDNETMALEDILDNAQQHRQWLRLKILDHWNSLSSLGVTMDNVRSVVQSLLKGTSQEKSSTKFKQKIKEWTPDRKK